MVGFSNNKGPEPTVGVKFISAGLAASFADCITFPLDTAKVRLQVGYLVCYLRCLVFSGKMDEGLCLQYSAHGVTIFNPCIHACSAPGWPGCFDYLSTERNLKNII